MAWSDYWNALGRPQRVRLALGAVLIIATTATAAWWLLRDPHVLLAAQVEGAELAELTQQLERAKVGYRITASGRGIEVLRSQLGKARASGAEQGGAAPSVGLELFKETDFSSSDFAQRINYQRALQGELTRTIQLLPGIRRARVHVILPEASVFKRAEAKATAAVSLVLRPGKSLNSAQVRGIQRLVAAAVPQIVAEDVVVLDESGTSLTRPAAAAESEASAPLDLKRQADQYLESKLTNLLGDLLPQGRVSLSVDAVLDERQLRVTTDEPLGARGLPTSTVATGVLVKERHTQRVGSGFVTASADGADPESAEREFEYRVGHRTEQMLSAPGSIRRVSVAVALQGAPADLTATAVEALVVSAVGIDRTRGDSVAVLMLPAEQRPAADPPAVILPTQVAGPSHGARNAVASLLSGPWLARAWPAALLAALALLVGAMWLRAAARRRRAQQVDVEVVAARIRQWLAQEAGNGSC